MSPRIKHGHRQVTVYGNYKTQDGKWAKAVLPQSRTYVSWRNMKYRAGKKEGYEHVTVCERWATFDNFLADMGTRPEGMTLDRIDPYQGYSKDNCRWATPTTQNRNKRKHVKHSYDCGCFECER